jgi:hypothetical protein
LRRLLVMGSLLTGGLGVGIGVAVTGGASAQGASQSVAGVEVAPTVAGVEQVALRYAAGDGDAAPTDVESASTSMGAASALLDESAPMNVDPRTGEPFAQTPVYVVTMRGRFVANGVPIPHGDVAPTGSTLDLIVDAKSGFVISVYITNEAALDLSQLTAPQSSAGTSDDPAPSSNTQEASHRATLASNTSGVLRGTGYFAGGPPPRPGTHGNPIVAPNLRIVVTKEGHFVASQHTSHTGTFMFHLRPGKYTLTPHIIESNWGCGSVGASVRAGQVTRIRLTCGVP